ncbi:MAG: carboxypeptidase-like regulatory domain-containing protein [Armatimonadota bacterium]
MSRYSRLIVVIATVAVLIIAGCGGDGPPQKAQPEPSPQPDTTTVTGFVVKADAPQEGIPGARVTATSSGTAQTAQDAAASDLTDFNGRFRIDDVPVGPSGTVDLMVETVNTSDYGNQKVNNVGISADEETNITIAVLPMGLGTPVRLTITPTNETVDLNGIIAFDATIMTTKGEVNVQPTWYLKSNIGEVDATGHFTALNQGEGEVVASIGNIQATANLTVTPSRPPEITTVVVNPKTLDAQGGTVQVTAAVNDGDGLATVEAQVTDPNIQQWNYDMPMVQGTTSRDGTFRTSIDIDPNDIREDEGDATRTLTYSIRVRAVDNRSNETFSDFFDVQVPGLDVPPTTPTL